jgi:hypothetical protein
MRIDQNAGHFAPPARAPIERTDLVQTVRAPGAPQGNGTTETAPEAPRSRSPLTPLIGNVDIRHISPRRMVDLSFDLYVAGFLQWEEYALLAFQSELHPAYDETIGALTGEAAEPDKPRDFLQQWEERLAFDLRYNAERPQMIAHTLRIVSVFRMIDQPTNHVV